MPTPKPTLELQTEVTAPDWNVVPFEVGCARCGHDLRGMTEPKCPACGLEFSWSQAVPIEQLTCRKCGYHLCGLRETRCPECGESFTWEQVLDDYHRKRKPLFEFRWRDRPVRSLVYTWWLALRPWKLWQTVDIHDPPRPVMLGVMAGVAAIVFMLAGVLPGTLAWVVYDVQSRRGWTARGFTMPSLVTRLPDYAMTSFHDHLEFAVTIGVWAMFSFLALLIFQQSMRIYKVRTSHVFRVWVLSVAILSPFACLVCFTTLAALRICDLPFYGPTEAGISASSALILVLYSAIAVILGYKVYLRMPHSVGVVVASQVIALLASASVCPWLVWLLR